MTGCKVVFQGESPDFPAARLGGTQLLTYGELLPAGTEKAILVLAPQPGTARESYELINIHIFQLLDYTNVIK